MGLVNYKSKFGSDSWNLARVVTVLPDIQNLVRTIEVRFGLSAVKGKQDKIVIPVQRFSPLQAVNSRAPRQ